MYFTICSCHLGVKSHILFLPVSFVSDLVENYVNTFSLVKAHMFLFQKYLLVMQSIFFPTPRIEERYDLKGCVYNRFQNVRDILLP